MTRFFKNSLFNDLIALCAGMGLPFAFAPFNHTLLAVVFPGFLLLTWFKSNPFRAFLRGFVFGLGFFGVGVYWIFNSVHNYGNAGIFLAGLITILLIFYLSLFPAIQGYLLSKFIFKSKNGLGITAIFSFAASWVVLEWIRGWLFTGFPWLLLGYSQLNSALAGYAPILGVYGLSFFVLLTSGSLVYIVQEWKKVGYFLLGMLLIWGIGAGLRQVEWTQPIDQPVKFSLVQGDIAQSVKWEPSHFEDTINRYLSLSESFWDKRLLVWPESAIPVALPYSDNVLEQLATVAKRQNTTLVVGVPEEVKIKPGEKTKQASVYYNSLHVVGVGSGTYYKRHLVPFGEYVPFESLLRGLIGFFNIPMSSFIEGPWQQEDLRIDGVRVAPYICYEIAFPEEVIATSKKANLLLTVSDDSWFGRSLALPQHVQMAALRALEVGKPVLFATNNGITALISAKGEIMQQIPPFAPGVLSSTIQARVGETPLIKFGIFPIILALFAILIFSWGYEAMISKRLVPKASKKSVNKTPVLQ